MPSIGFDIILCPVDFSEISANALRQASQLAACGGSRVIAAYANWFEVPPYLTQSRIEELKRKSREDLADAERSVAGFVKSALGDVEHPLDIRVVEGSPAEAIQGLAKDEHAGLIVMGTHGRTGVNRWMLGSVAERVIRESEVPVLTVRAAPRGKLENILVPVNDTPLSLRALKVAARFAAACDAAVTVLHVQEAHGDHPIPNLCEWIPSAARSRCIVRELVRHGDPAEQIIALASEMPCDLLVMGAPERRFFEGMVLSRTALRVIRHAPCPVLSQGDPRES